VSTLAISHAVCCSGCAAASLPVVFSLGLPDLDFHLALPPVRAGLFTVRKILPGF
jgi:hypothetical protein